MEKIKAMLTLQQQLNDATNGQGWEKGHTQHGKSIDWRRCIYLEAAELIESYPWKHWKNNDAKPDYENIKIEAVDIWHFVMSEALRLYKVEEKGSIEDLAMAISQEEGYRGFVDNASVTYQDHYAEIAIVEDFVKSLFCNEPIEVLVSKFFGVAQLSGLDLEKLYLLYIGKNILNTFRQDHGYKEGSYLKLWGGREDNVLMQEILESHKDISPEMLYKKLEEVYPG
jgi:dimeric dUTPase (all-alpha-NTP-PPase superfamily)